LHSNEKKITIVDEKSSVKLGKVIVKEEIIIPKNNDNFDNLFLVHFNDYVYYFVKYIDEETLKNDGKIHNSHKMNDNFMYISEVVGYHFGKDGSDHIKIE
jgi:hypothetical protein